MSKINILHIITGLGMGGAEKVVFNLSQYINKNEFNSFIVAMSTKDTLLNDFIDKNVDVYILRKSKTLIDIYTIIKTINSLIKEKSIDIIHAHMVHSMMACSILKILNPSVKIVFTAHSINLGSKFREVLIYLLRPLRNVDIIFSKENVQFFQKKKNIVIPNGILVKNYELNLQKNNLFTFVSVGRLEEVKNHILLIDIVESLSEEFEFQLLIAGDGHLKNNLEKLIKEKNLSSKIKLLGLRKDIPSILNTSHCFVLPSLWEGFPIALLEAGASKLPIITNTVGSIPSFLNNENAYVIQLHEFEKTMREVIQNYENAKAKSEILFTAIHENYSIQANTEKHESLYKNLLNDI